MRDKSGLSQAVCLAHLYKVYQFDSLDAWMRQPSLPSIYRERKEKKGLRLSASICEKPSIIPGWPESIYIL